jgi:DNA-binding transcriptional MerR regulator
MASPEIQRRVGQLRHDVDDVFELLDTTNQTVGTVAAMQRRHGTRLEEIQQTLDLTVGRLGRLEQTQHRIEGAQQEQNTRLDRLEHRLDRLDQTQQEQNAKLDAILTVLRGDPASG